MCIQKAQANPILIPVSRILRDYWHLEPYLLEHEVSLKGLAELSFSITDLNLPNSKHWTVMSIVEDHFLCNVKGQQNISELTDDEAIALHNLTNLALEIHTLISDMYRQYSPYLGFTYHRNRQWIGGNVLVESYK
jgi:Rieske Fe-S protein